MLELTVRFESSWSNSLAQHPGGPPRFTSGSELAKSVKGLQRPPVEGDGGAAACSATTESGSGPLPYLRQLQAANPTMQYRVPVNYDRTVQGVLARLVGEVRRLDMLAPDHLALRAFACGQAHVHHAAVYAQTTTLTSATANPIQSGGAGLIVRDGIYQHGEAARQLLGFLGMDMAQLEAHAPAILGRAAPWPVPVWTPASPSQLLHRLLDLQTQQAECVKAAHRQARDSGTAYVCPYPQLLAMLQQHLPQEMQDFTHKAQAKVAGSDKTAQRVEDQWWLAAALVVLQIKQLPAQQRQALIAAQVLSANGNLPGIAMTGSVGAVTAKDLFKFASGRYQYAHRLPYSVELPLATSHAKGHPIMAPAGVIKKDGTLTFSLRDQPELELALYTAIRAASVGPLHFGKKGIAWLETMEMYA